MSEERIHEPIAVSAAFEAGVVTPTHMAWNSRRMAVTTVHARWTTRDGRHPVRNFSVETESGDVYHISLATDACTWRLERVLLP